MKLTLSIETETCLQCGKCARVCPADVLQQANKKNPITIQYLESCIRCGHCVDVCPTNSIHHSAFPPERIHAIDNSLLPTPEQVMMLIQSRRSNRSLKPQAIEKQALLQIIEAAKYAPTGSNNQQVSVTLITKPETLRQASEITIRTFDSLLKILNSVPLRWILKPFLRDTFESIPAFRRYKQQHAEGGDPILRHASALLVFHTPTSSELGCQDASLAYQNASLMAQSLGISQIFMGFVMRAIKLGRRKTFARLFGVNGQIHAIMALGIPSVRFVNYVDR